MPHSQPGSPPFGAPPGDGGAPDALEIAAADHSADVPTADHPAEPDPTVGWRRLVEAATVEIDRRGRIGAPRAPAGAFAALGRRAGVPFADLLRASDRVAWLHALDAARRGEVRSLRLAVCPARDGRSWIDAAVRIAPAAGDGPDAPVPVALEPVREADAPAPRLAELAHELRTPLNAVRGYAQALEAELFGALGPRQRDAVRAIADASEHLIEISNAVLDGARLGAGDRLDRAEGDPAEAVARACAMLRGMADRAGVTIAHRPGPAPRVPHDAAALRQIALNLVSNAIKASPPGAVVGVDVRSIAEGDGAAEPGATAGVEIAVRDAGTGIPAEHAGGTGAAWGRGIAAEGEATGGVGLPLVRRLCALHGGALRFGTRPGGGTVATVTLPASPITAPATPAAEADAADDATDSATGSGTARETPPSAHAERIRRFERAFPCRLVG